MKTLDLSNRQHLDLSPYLMVISDYEKVDLSNTSINNDTELGIVEFFSTLTIENLKEVDLTNCKIETKYKEIIISSMFMDLPALEKVEGFSSFIQINKNITNMSLLFFGCTRLKSIDFGDNYTFNNKVKYNRMFSKCTSLKYVNLGNIDNIPITTANIIGMFKGINPNCEIRHKGKFRLADDFYAASSVYFPIGDDWFYPNTPNKYTELFIRKCNLKMLLNNLIKYMHIQEESLDNSQIRIITYKTQEELESIKAKQALFGTQYLDMDWGLVYFSSDYEEIIILQEESI